MTKDKSNKKKTVSWASNGAIQEHIVHHEDISNSWYKKHEIVALNRENREMCWLANHGQLILNDESSNDCFCSRGLEAMIDTKIKQARTWRKQTATSLVLEEQDYQYEQNFFSPIRIAEIYRFISSLAQNEANERGLADQEEANSIQEQEEQKEEDVQKSKMLKTPCRNSIQTFGQPFQSMIRSRRLLPQSA